MLIKIRNKTLLLSTINKRIEYLKATKAREILALVERVQERHNNSWFCKRGLIKEIGDKQALDRIYNNLEWKVHLYMIEDFHDNTIKELQKIKSAIECNSNSDIYLTKKESNLIYNK